jgi:hypothetical protein
MTPRRGLLLIVAMLLPIGAFQAPADEPSKPKWKELFDGKSLEGWKSSEFFGSGKIVVQDGAILMQAGEPMTGVTYARDDFPKLDYEVSLEAKKVAGDDFFCTTTFPIGEDFCSLVVGGWGGTVVGLSSLNQLDASMNETTTSSEFARDRWYPVRIRVTRNRIQAWIGDERVVDVDTTDKVISIRGECRKSRPFGIATYRTTGAVRNIKLRPLTEAEKQEVKKG